MLPIMEFPLNQTVFPFVLQIPFEKVFFWHPKPLSKTIRRRDWNIRVHGMSQVTIVLFFLISQITLPETNMTPENRPSQKGNWYSNHPFSGAMLFSGRVRPVKKSGRCELCATLVECCSRFETIAWIQGGFVLLPWDSSPSSHHLQ